MQNGVYLYNFINTKYEMDVEGEKMSCFTAMFYLDYKKSGGKQNQT